MIYRAAEKVPELINSEDIALSYSLGDNDAKAIKKYLKDNKLSDCMIKEFKRLLLSIEKFYFISDHEALRYASNDRVGFLVEKETGITSVVIHGSGYADVLPASYTAIEALNKEALWQE